MPQIQDWISQRLKKISQNEFTHQISHRTFSFKKGFSLVQEYFSVPLSSGCGAAVLTAPNNEVLDNNYAPLVILFHSLGQDCTSPFSHWIYEFASNGIAVLSIDWDGHGAGSSSLLDMQEATRSIPLILQRLYGEDGGTGLNERRIGPACFLMGHSFGANLALISATREDVSKYVNGVIAVSPALYIQSSVRMLFELLAFFNPFTWFSDFSNKLSFYGIWGLVPAYGFFKRKYFPIRMKIDINYIDQARDFSSETFEKRRILKKIKTPILWFHGMKDYVSPYYKVCKLMLEISSAFFIVSDNKRGHWRMIFNDHILSSSINFIKNNIKYYNLNKIRDRNE